ncbi:MAG: hypothetical protein ACO1OT_04575 [Heyndrickxia sp.]
MKHILERCKLMLNQQHLALVIDMLSLKLLSDQFENERIEIRNDFLVRGICEKEVDGLIEEPSYYKIKFVPINARWNHLKEKKTQLAQSFPLALKELVPSYNETWDISDYTIANIINILDMYEFNVKTKSEIVFVFQQLNSWIEENNIGNKGLLFHLLKSECLK